MNPTDIIVIAAEGLPFECQLDLMKWWQTREPGQAAKFGIHPSIRWWWDRHADELKDPHYLHRMVNQSVLQSWWP